MGLAGQTAPGSMGSSISENKGESHRGKHPMLTSDQMTNDPPTNSLRGPMESSATQHFYDPQPQPSPTLALFSTARYPNLYPTASWKWPDSHETRCNAGLCFHCHQTGLPHELAAQAPGSSPLEAPQPQAPPQNAFGWTLETTPGPQGVLHSSRTGADKASVLIKDGVG